jgi:hypothetical protein
MYVEMLYRDFRGLVNLTGFSKKSSGLRDIQETFAPPRRLITNGSPAAPNHDAALAPPHKTPTTQRQKSRLERAMEILIFFLPVALVTAEYLFTKFRKPINHADPCVDCA